ncbi:hypothetical protein WJX82_002675 [Trebouxia sp. C0006]
MEMLMISTLDQETVVTLQRSLQSITSLLALQTRHLPSVQLGLCGVVQHKEDVRLQMIMRPQHFDLRQWHVSLQKLPALLAGTSMSSTKSTLAAQTLVNFLAGDKALSSCSKSVTIIGQAFEHVTAFADVLKSAAENCIQVDFVAIPDSGNSCSMTEMEWADFATGLADYENASASYCPCDPFAIHQLCLRWLHSALHPQPSTVTLHLPAPPSAPQACVTPTPSSNPTVDANANSPASSHPSFSHTPHGGSSTGPLLNQTVSASHGSLPASLLKQSAGMVQVGQSTTLSMPSAQAAELQSANETGHGDESSLHVVKRIRVHELSESLLFGWPNILIPHADSFDSIQDMEANEQCFTGLCQVLDEQQEVLLFKGCLDLDTMKATSWPLHYAARPACNGCSMLVRRIAASEELLPVSHLLARQAPEVPSHVRAGLQHSLQGVPVSEYSPLDNHSGAMDKIAGLVSQSQNSIDCMLLAKQNRM